MNKTPAMAYYSRKIRTTDRVTLSEEIENAPLKKMERHFLWDIVEGMTYKELADKYNKSEARVYQIKRKLFEFMTMYDRRRLS